MRSKFPAVLRWQWWCFELCVLILRFAHKTLSTIAPYSPPHVELPPEHFKPSANMEVRKSTIPAAGLGLFSVGALESGVRIGEYVGDVIDSLFRSLRVRDIEYLVMNEKRDGAIDATRHPRMLLRYVNHHPDRELANVRFCPQGGRVFLETTRAVEANEEFFADYGVAYWRIRKIKPVAPSSAEG